MSSQPTLQVVVANRYAIVETLLSPSTDLIATRYPRVSYCSWTALAWYIAIAMVGGKDALNIIRSVVASSPDLDCIFFRIAETFQEPPRACCVAILSSAREEQEGKSYFTFCSLILLQLTS